MDLTSLIDANKLGGWVRAGVGAAIAAAIAQAPWLKEFVTPEVQTALGIVASGLVVGAWSHFAKYLKDRK
jgi:hypothetical protein